jgi:hypothetical protein
MSDEDGDFEDKRRYGSPYTAHHPVPTVRQYREEKKQRRATTDNNAPPTEAEGYDAENKNIVPASSTQGDPPLDSEDEHDGSSTAASDDHGSDTEGDEVQDTSETLAASAGSPKAKRKEMKKRSGDRAEREVTDPVTHLPVQIHDFTNEDLKQATEEDEDFHAGIMRRESSFETNDKQMEKDAELGKRSHQAMERLFPTPDHESTQQQITAIMTNILFVAVISLTVLSYGFTILRAQIDKRYMDHLSSGSKLLANAGLMLIFFGTSALVCYGITSYGRNQAKDALESQTWEAERERGNELSKKETPESTHWLNSVLASVWPLVNPDLFVSLSDTLEDVMQASLPKLIRMISVEDIGQGSESLRILGVKWLPKGAATHTVSAEGKIEKNRPTKPKESDRTDPDQGNMENPEGDDAGDKSNSKENPQESENMAEGMEAEEGEFVNLEIAFAYRSRPSGHGMKSRSKNPHLYLAFYLMANIKFPVWVELRGLIGTMRLRLQLTPDPPFFALCTLTFLGQPKVNLSCVPLVKRGLNIMDVPLISNFVQSSVDAAMAEYVAPKSLTLDLKDMLVGEDFKKDTIARGVLVIRIKRGYDFKEGDAAIPLIRDGSTDGYVTVGWAKFGKAVWSTRVISSDMHPHWDETAFVLVRPEEINVHERLRVQLWDSDRTTADDDLGRIEVDLKEIMFGTQSRGKMWERADGFRSLKAGESMPGKLEWSVGYFPKCKVLDEQLAAQKDDPEVKSVADLKAKVEAESKDKLREARHDETSEIEQQKAQDFKAKQDQFIINSPPPDQFPSGILSIVIHQITGLELEAINKNESSKHDVESDGQEGEDDLPSSYCTIVLNHQQIYKTRTKPKNSKPFFNAGCERFVPDIQNAQVHIAVRDARVHEDDALIGVVYLPLKDIFEERSQINDFFPLAGGVGFGKVRVSLVFRSLEMSLPRERLGWELGTLQVAPEITGNVDSSISSRKIKIWNKHGAGKFRAASQTSWKSKHGGAIWLPFKQRYSSPFVVEFRSNSSMNTGPKYFAIYWLKDVPDDEEVEISLPVWKGDLDGALKNVLEEYGEKVGEVQLKLTFWSGLSGYHINLAKQDRKIEDVMEILDCANDVENNETVGSEASDNSSDSDDEDSNSPNGTEKDRKSRFVEDQTDFEHDGKRGLLSQVEDYNLHKKQLHRRNRGLMQWKARPIIAERESSLTAIGSENYSMGSTQAGPWRAAID